MINEVLTVKEAAELWQKNDRVLRQVFQNGKKFEIGKDIRKSGNTWLVTRESMVRVYGINNLKEGLEDMDIRESLRENFRKVINDEKILLFENEDDFNYAIGQVVRYMINKEKEQNTRARLERKLINNYRNYNLVFNTIKNIFIQTSKYIDFEDYRFRKAYSTVLNTYLSGVYNTLNNEGKTKIQIGLLDNNSILDI